MADPFNLLSNKLGQFFQAIRGNKRAQSPNTTEAGVDNPFYESMPLDGQGDPDEHTYFRAITRLNALREQTKREIGLSAGDLIHMLDRFAYHANFDPVGAVTFGQTADDYFQSDSRFIELESQLSRKIEAGNVSEVLDLVKDATFYTPTARVVRVIEATYLKMLTGNKNE